MKIDLGLENEGFNLDKSCTRHRYLKSSPLRMRTNYFLGPDTSVCQDDASLKHQLFQRLQLVVNTSPVLTFLSKLP